MDAVGKNHCKNPYPNCTVNDAFSKCCLKTSIHYASSPALKVNRSSQVGRKYLISLIPGSRFRAGLTIEICCFVEMNK